MNSRIITFFIFIFFINLSCKERTSSSNTTFSQQSEVENQKESDLQKKYFDTIINGKEVNLYLLKNDSIQAAFTNYGGRIIGLKVPDKNGKMTDVVVGMNSIKAYAEASEPYFGATIGRVANRIDKGKFEIDGKQYTIPQNNGDNSLHGGENGFQYVVFDANQINDHTLVLTYKSQDGEEGFPGNLEVKVSYTLTKDRALKIEYKAQTDKVTPVNLTNHAFFNLNGEGSGSVLGHKLQIFANYFTPVNEGLIPTGELRNVKNTPFDFRELHEIGEGIDTKNTQLEYGVGYDHNYVLSNSNKGEMNHAAKVIGDKSGIVMDVYTEEPGLQFYSGNFMQGKNTFKNGSQDEFRTAFALETQHFPNTPNQPDFPSINLEKDEIYHTVSVYKFNVLNE